MKMRFGTECLPPEIDPGLPSKINALVDSGEKFLQQKRDRSTTVGIVKGHVLGFTCDLCIKRFNYKGFLSFLLKMTFGSRAKRLWKTNLRLYELGLPVPQPIACIEPSLSVKHSFFLSSVIGNAQNLGFILENKLLDKPEETARKLAKIMAEWHLSGAVHGDMKFHNIMLQSDGSERRFFFVDLDQARIFNQPEARGLTKDLIRFYRSGLELGAEDWVEYSFFPEYLFSIGNRIGFKIDFASIKDKAVQDWDKKGRPRYKN
jgi:tRNA A-37 threonylcarbamoyl transferase component Bud32